MAKMADPRPCEQCGESFTPLYKRRGQRFCSRACQTTFVRPIPTHEQVMAAVRESVRVRQARSKSRYVRRGHEFEHRIIAAQMLGRPLTADEVVHHINGDGRDNRPENLRVYASNSDHIRDHGFTGENHPRAVLTQSQADEMRAIYQAGGCSTRQLAKRFQVSATTAKRVVAGQAYTTRQETHA